MQSVIHNSHIYNNLTTHRLSVEPPVLADALLALFDDVPSGSAAAGSSGGGGGANGGLHSPSSAPARRKLWSMTLLFLLSGGQWQEGQGPGPGQPQPQGVEEGGRRQALVMGMLGRMEQVGGRL